MLLLLLLLLLLQKVSGESEPLWRLMHDDGDGEDADEQDVRAAVSAANANSVANAASDTYYAASAAYYAASAANAYYAVDTRKKAAATFNKAIQRAFREAK